MCEQELRIGIDIGGTYTDFVVLDPTSGDIETLKILSTPQTPEKAVLDGLSQLTNMIVGVSCRQGSIVHGSTVATNAVIERKGANTALVTTLGFRDILTIGRQNRDQIYDLFADRTPPLISSDFCFEITERVNCKGEILTQLVEDEITPLIETLSENEIESVAINLLFSFLNPDHENQIALALRESGFFVSCSSEILPEFREYERASTVAINAYVTPILNRYIGRLEQTLTQTDFNFSIMQSNGGSIRANHARREAVRCILSGPAGGVVGAIYTAQAAGFRKIITFDMGGTSTDVSLSQGDIRVTTEAKIGGLPLRIPIIDIHTVGAGGGSIAHIDIGGALSVGPQSAGSDPGPVCYGMGGCLPTVTDANVVLGRLAPEHFLSGEIEIDKTLSISSLTNLYEQAKFTPYPGLTDAQTAALGVIRVANAHMQRALRIISTESGFDPRDFSLVSFGGAGGLHACDMARELSIERVLIPRGAATLSAFGMLAADVIKDYVQTIMMPDNTSYATLKRMASQMAEQGQREVHNDGIPEVRISWESELDMRYHGQSHELGIPLTPCFIDNFHKYHHEAYGNSDSSASVVIVNLRVRVVGAVLHPPLLPKYNPTADESKVRVAKYQPVVIGNKITRTPIFLGEELNPGHIIAGPALIVQPDTTVLLSNGDEAIVDKYLNLLITVFPVEQC